MSNSVPPYAGPILNEIMARNRTGAVDSLGRRSEWIELRNTNAAAFSLTGMMLSTDSGKGNRWPFPAGVSIPANGYLTVWCDVSRAASTIAEINLNTCPDAYRKRWRDVSLQCRRPGSGQSGVRLSGARPFDWLEWRTLATPRLAHFRHCECGPGGFGSRDEPPDQRVAGQINSIPTIGLKFIIPARSRSI